MQAKKGFTLIELLVVTTIIGLLATFSVVALNNAREKSNDSRRVSDIKQIQIALEHYSNIDNNYSVTEMNFINPIPENLNSVNCNNLNHNNYNSTAGNTYTLKYCVEKNTRAVASEVLQNINFY